MLITEKHKFTVLNNIIFPTALTDQEAIRPNNYITMNTFRKYEFGSQGAATTKINALGVDEEW